MEEIGANIFVAFFTALATGIVSSFLYWRKARADLQKEYESRFNQQKWDAYTQFVHFCYQLLGKKLDDGQVEKVMEIADRLYPAMALVASDEVLEAFAEMNIANRKDTRRRVVRVVKAMRKDLGYKTTSVAEESLFTSLIGRPKL